jgi:hypothetical protein
MQRIFAGTKYTPSVNTLMRDWESDWAPRARDELANAEAEARKAEQMREQEEERQREWAHEKAQWDAMTPEEKAAFRSEQKAVQERERAVHDDLWARQQAENRARARSALHGHRPSVKRSTSYGNVPERLRMTEEEQEKYDASYRELLREDERKRAQLAAGGAPTNMANGHLPHQRSDGEEE